VLHSGTDCIDEEFDKPGKNFLSYSLIRVVEASRSYSVCVPSSWL